MKNPGESAPYAAEEATSILLCRPGFEDVLCEELNESGEGSRGPDFVASGSGWVAFRRNALASDGPEAARLVFARQEMPAARLVSGTRVPDVAAAAAAIDAPRAAGAAAPHYLHVFTPDPAGVAGLTGRARSLQRAVARDWAGRHPGLALLAGPVIPAHRAAGAGTVWQLCVVAEGVWSAVTPLARLKHPHPGGQHHERRDPAAPSRSTLKLEEALAVLGREPAPGERVVDLGAAPGGWSYAALRRGCRVLAVDNGPMRIPGQAALPGTLEHRRADGLRFRPPAEWLPVDWLLADMLIAPGLCLGLLRKWLDEGWAQHLVVNVKLPQRNPLVALRPLRDYLAAVPGLEWSLRQLYHDRREVTLMARRVQPEAQPRRVKRPAARTTGGRRSRRRR